MSTAKEWQSVESRGDGDTCRLPVHDRKGILIGYLYRCREWHGPDNTVTSVSTTFVPMPD